MLKNKINLYICLFYFLIISAVYSQIVFFGKTLVPNLYYPKGFSPVAYEGRRPINTFNIDLATPTFYEMPVNKLIGDMYLKGTLPLWDPYEGVGVPLAAQYSTRVFFPYQILEDISPYWLWDYFILGRLLIAAFFTYLFLRLLGISYSCAFLGGLLYSLSGSFVWFVNLEQFVNVAMMIPVCLFSLERILQFKKRRYFIEAAVVFALMLLAGQPEIAIYVMLLVTFYYFFRILIEKPNILSFLKETLRFVGILILSLSFSLFLILPFLEFIPNAYHCHPLGGTMGTQEPTRLHLAIGVIIPSFFELPTFHRIFPHNGAWDSLGGYTGVLMIYLILSAFFYKYRYQRLFLFFSLFGFSIILKNFGFPLIAWLGKLPLLDQSWSPRWAGPVWTFSLACASALGLQAIIGAKYRKKVLPWGISFFLLFIIGLLSYKTTYFSQFKDLNTDQLKVVLPPILGGLIVAILTIFTLTYISIYSRNKKSLLYSIICLAILELSFYIPKGIDFPWTVYKFVPFFLGAGTVFLLANEKWNLSIAGIILVVLSYVFIDIESPYGFPDRYNLFKKSDYIKFLEEDKDFFRIIAGGGILMPNFPSAFRLFDIRYITSLSPATYQNYVDQHLLKSPHEWITDRLWFTGLPDIHKSIPRSIYDEIRDNLLYYSYLGVKYIISNNYQLLGLPLVYDKEVKIYKNTHYIPRLYIAHKIEYSSTYQEAQSLMAKTIFDIKDTVILEEGPPEWYKFSTEEYANKKYINSLASIEEYSLNRIKIQASLKENGILVLTDLFYPGWKAHSGNKEAKIYRVNGLVRGIFLKKGKHSITFKYSPFSFRMGVVISGLSLLLTLALVLFLRPRCV